eukprot:m.379390 g.379390  ORF g.379390 m.379390 type:complete len:687 (-) comp20953_c0_seq1:513-2573(-)
MGEFIETKDLIFRCSKPARDKYYVDEVCDCSSSEGSRCGDETCMNRAMLVECSQDCNLGKKCKNRRIQRRQGIPCEVFDAGQKGRGLRVKTSVSSDAFIGEYVGEVINAAEFTRRYKVHMETEKAHFYFMNLDADHIIDASKHGSITRFVNHSCDPNCKLEKWLVDGYQRLGFYAMKDMQAGDEVTIDYQYQRISDVSQPCYCESSNCRGQLVADTDKEDTSSHRRLSSGSARKSAKQMESVLDGLRDDQGGLAAAAVVPMLKTMRGTTDTALRRMLMVVLATTKEDAPCLHQFLRRRGLHFLGVYLTEFVEGNEADLIDDMLKLLIRLPVNTKNVVAHSGLERVLPLLKSHERPAIVSDATKLIEHWASLPEVTVIEKLSLARPLEMEIARDHVRFFKESTMRRMEHDSGALLSFTRDTTSPHRVLKISGKQSAIDKCRVAVETLSASAASELESERIRLLEVQQRKREREERDEQRRESAFATTGGTLAEDKRQRPSSADVMDTGLSDWKATVDPSTGRTYYYNEITQETTWTLPSALGVTGIQPPHTATTFDRLCERPDKPAITTSNPELLNLIQTSTAAASSAATNRADDVSEEHGLFKKEVSACVHGVLRRYRKKDCTVARITRDDDYKHLARKLTHLVIKKEGKGKSCDEAMKHKIKNFIKSYMKKIGTTHYSRTNPTSE